MTKTLQSNNPNKNMGGELDAESVPSSLRIVCDDASSINLLAAEAAEEGKPALRKFSMVHTPVARCVLVVGPSNCLVVLGRNRQYYGFAGSFFYCLFPNSTISSSVALDIATPIA
jgi:hypothetical protein